MFNRPAGLLLLLGTLLFALPLAGFIHQDDTEPLAADSPGWIGTAPAWAATMQDDGEQIYMTRCMSCHQIDGKGISGVFPPLDETEWVVGDKGRLIRIVLDGMMGETEVQGVVYSGAMPPWKSFMNDEEIAAVLTYIRAAWSNEASAVTTAEVAAVRAATKDRSDSWTEEELKDAANQGIPGSFDMLGSPADTTGR